MKPRPVDQKDSLLPSGVPAWGWLLWLTLTGYLFNLWTTYGLRLPSLLDYEVPSREALVHGRAWTMLTYIFANGGANDASDWLLAPLSLALLVIVARLVEQDLGRKQFVLLCSGCALLGAAAWLPLHWSGGEQLLSGCTTLVLGLLTFWCFTAPEESTPVRLLLVGVTRPQVFFWIALAFETGGFLVFELPQILGIPGAFSGSMDNSAQLGAMVAGWAFARAWRRAPTPDGFFVLPDAAEPRRQQPTVVPAGAVRAEAAEFSITSPAKATPASRREVREEIDRILDKINRDGFGALTEREHKILADAKDWLKK